MLLLLGGLWHGASWNFVLWGGWHGALLSAERVAGARAKPRGLLYPLRWLLTFVAVLLGWVLFRASGFRESMFVYREMFTQAGGAFLLAPGHLILVAVAVLFAVAQERRDLAERFAAVPVPIQVAALTAVLLCLELFGVTDEKLPFIYFQF